MERWGEEVRVRSAVYERVEVNVSKACHLHYNFAHLFRSLSLCTCML